LVLEIESHAAGAELVLVEGVGGVLSPITWDRNIVDLGRVLEARVLLVTSDQLGAISQTLLALSALEFAGMDVCGLILAAPAAPDASTGTNAAAIARLSGLERIAMMPRRNDPRPAGSGLAQVVDWVLPSWGRHASESLGAGR